jgi:peptidoglycan/LPS O-acetylase OafA/YrhL
VGWRKVDLKGIDNIAGSESEGSETGNEARRLGVHEPGLDFLRTLAILLVFICHLPWHQVPHFLFSMQQFGWIGVDLFFVLSGYLIGLQLLRPYTINKKPFIGDFFIRRSFRVLPAFLVVLLLYCTISVFKESETMRPFWQFFTFTQNFGLVPPSAFSHAWSLCVEEHFYWILPFLVLWLMQRPRFSKVAFVAAAILVGGLLMRSLIWLHFFAPLAQTPDNERLLFGPYFAWIYYPTPTRLDGLLVGVLIAALKLFRPTWWKAVMAKKSVILIAGLVIIGCAVKISWDRFSWAAVILGFPILAIGFGLLVTSMISDGSGWSVRVPGAATGAAWTYSFYLTHKEVMHLDRLYLGDWVQSNRWVALGIYVFTSLIVAATLYHIVERPFLQMRDRLTTRQASSRAFNLQMKGENTPQTNQIG